eukprot:TRINITY_DN7636_c0_g1_i1.p1 TRINITY_DN7636_c0_g1~~TRINITY_DN7636_c0_g1_i1.p1  ORF type:complete len:735 (+),score=238.23 TRINITY_DN7636_c0_g1_i1:433-2637(+)
MASSVQPTATPAAAESSTATLGSDALAALNAPRPSLLPITSLGNSPNAAITKVAGTTITNNSSGPNASTNSQPNLSPAVVANSLTARALLPKASGASKVLKLSSPGHPVKQPKSASSTTKPPTTTKPTTTTSTSKKPSTTAPSAAELKAIEHQRQLRHKHRHKRRQQLKREEHAILQQAKLKDDAHQQRIQAMRSLDKERAKEIDLMRRDIQERIAQGTRTAEILDTITKLEAQLRQLGDRYAQHQAQVRALVTPPLVAVQEPAPDQAQADAGEQDAELAQYADDSNVTSRNGSRPMSLAAMHGQRLTRQEAKRTSTPESEAEDNTSDVAESEDGSKTDVFAAPTPLTRRRRTGPRQGLAEKMVEVEEDLAEQEDNDDGMDDNDDNDDGSADKTDSGSNQDDNSRDMDDADDDDDTGVTPLDDKDDKTSPDAGEDSNSADQAEAELEAVAFLASHGNTISPGNKLKESNADHTPVPGEISPTSDDDGASLAMLSSRQRKDQSASLQASQETGTTPSEINLEGSDESGLVEMAVPSELTSTTAMPAPASRSSRSKTSTAAATMAAMAVGSDPNPADQGQNPAEPAPGRRSRARSKRKAPAVDEEVVPDLVDAKAEEDEAAVPAAKRSSRRRRPSRNEESAPEKAEAKEKDSKPKRKRNRKPAGAPPQYTIQPNGTKVFTCEDCGREFTHPPAYAQHRRSHNSPSKKASETGESPTKKAQTESVQAPTNARRSRRR